MKKKARTHDYPDTGSDRLNRILWNLHEVWQIISGALLISIEPEEHAKAEKRRNHIIIGFLIILLLVLLLIVGVPWIKYFNSVISQKVTNSDGLQFISSFWGAIIGALLAASLTIISTWMIINRSYRVDFHRDRIDHLPVLSLREMSGAVYNEVEIKLRDGTSVWSVQEFQTSNHDVANLCKILEISNIGSGIALSISTTSGYDDEIPAYFTGITPKNVVYLVYGASSKVPCGTINLWFQDIFENKYLQKFNYELNDKNDMFFIGGSVPTLVERTRRIRYLQ